MAERATVLLQNGGQATGEIVVYLPNDRITLDLGGGERVTFAASDIAEVRKEGAAPAPVAVAAPVASGAAYARPPLREADPADEAARANPMNWFGVGIKLGLRGTVNTQSSDYLIDMERTPEFHLAVPFNFGGDGFGWVLEPGVSVGKAYFGDEFDRTAEASLVSMALYTGPTLNLHLHRVFYLGLGVGPRGSYGFWSKNGGKANPIEVAVRVPVTGTFYLGRHIALVIEAAVGGGFCWWLTDYLGGNGSSPVFIGDLTTGVRWP